MWVRIQPEDHRVRHSWHAETGAGCWCYTANPQQARHGHQGKGISRNSSGKSYYAYCRRNQACVVAVRHCFPSSEEATLAPHHSGTRIKPRLIAVVTASVRSFAPSFTRQLAIWLRAVLSLM